ncbi:MAG: hypothetical protein IJX97_04095 [Clostridia bacterium]|nr:hypothetical protein [Clostridia bacterium]MBQ8720077.1 hypothetical protein [Clostridia bacterium]
MLKSRYENRFLSFIKERKRATIALIVAALALILILLGSGGGEAEEDLSGTEAYGALLEARVEKLLSDTDGVGKCEVMITFECGERKVFDGSREVGTLPPRVLAVTVLCDGADKISVKRELCDTLSEMFDIGTHKVKVMKIN